MVLSTIGYEGLDVETFFGILMHNGVKTIVDIRELPISRKRGFSKTILSTRAVSYGLKYVHLPVLGAPRDIRHEYREDEDWERFSDRYLAYLRMQGTEIARLAELVNSEECCLLCFESDHLRCHRRYVANALFAKSDGALKINHLAAKETMPVAWLRPSVGRVIQQ